MTRRAASLRLFALYSYSAVAFFNPSFASDDCVDYPDDYVSQIVYNNSGYVIDGCSDPQIVQQGICFGSALAARVLCCRTCLNLTNPVPPTSLPPGGDENHPVQIYVQAGQSECAGQASPDLLIDDVETYPDLVGPQDGVWFAGLAELPNYAGGQAAMAPSRFFIGPMTVGNENPRQFGPEIAIGRRIADAAAASPSSDDAPAPVMIVKYCWGGSNVGRQWNPTTVHNDWDRSPEVDDGTSSHLLDVGAAVLGSKNNLYGNLIYTVRKAVETLQDASIPYEYAGFFWIQGQADKDRTWKEYGTDLVTLFTAVRDDLNEPTLPIVDTGGTPHHNLQTGKMYAASIIDGCNVEVSAFAISSADPDSDCVPGPSNPCTGLSFVNWDVFDHYGYDPVVNIPPHDAYKPPGSSDEDFYWYKDFPNNLHSEYEAMILKGRMIANDYIRTFTDWTLTVEMTRDDPAELFPWDACLEEDGGGPSDQHICWIDMRDDEALAMASCDGAHPAKAPTSAPTKSPADDSTEAPTNVPTNAAPTDGSSAVLVSINGVVLTVLLSLVSFI